MTTRKKNTKPAKKLAAKKSAVKNDAKKTIASSRVTAKRAVKITPAKQAVKPARETLVTLRAHIDSVEKRLKRADSLTKTSIKALKSSYERLNGDTDQAPLAAHIGVLSDRLSNMIAQTRKDVAHDLQIVLEDPRIETIGVALTKANQRLTRAETQQASAINAINEQIADLAIAVDERMSRETRAREEGHAVLTQRIDSIETSSSDAIKMIGEKVLSVNSEISHRAEENIQKQKQASAEQALSQQQELEEHKSEIGRRIEDLEDDQRNSIPSIERRLVTLSTRLETLENNGAVGGLGAARLDMSVPDAEMMPPPPDMGKPEFAVSEQMVDVMDVSSRAAVENDAFASVDVIQKESVESPYTQASNAVNSGMAASTEAQSGYQQQNYVPQVYAQQNADPEMDHSEDLENNPYASRLAGQAQAFVPEPYPEPVNGFADNSQLAQGVYDTENTSVNTDLGNAAPPPMPLMQMDQNRVASVSNDEQTMDIARPGADIKSPRRKRKFKLKGKTKHKKPQANSKQSSANDDYGIGDNDILDLPAKNSNVKKIALMAGAALVVVFAATTMIPKVLGVDSKQGTNNAQPNRTIASVEAGVGTSSEALPTLPSLGIETSGSGAQAIETIEPTGDFAQASRKTLDLGGNAAGSPNARKLTLQAAVKDGDPIAQFQSGLIHLEAGRDAEAVRLIRLAANQGQPAAQYRLAKMYEVGIGVNTDVQTAMDLLERSANAGNRVAMHDVGHFYITGTGGAQNMDKAMEWFEMAAAHGFLDSQFNLGVLYQGAQNVEQDLEKSYMWYAIAAKQGDKIAAQRRELLSRELSTDQLSAVQARVKSFAPRRQNNAANGVFNDLPWAQAAQKKTSNASVKQAQELLSGLGYGVGAPDGAMGPKTRNAIISFERANGLPETGRVDAALLDRLSLAVGA